jgi:hypothetical protein
LCRLASREVCSKHSERFPKPAIAKQSRVFCFNTICNTERKKNDMNAKRLTRTTDDLAVAARFNAAAIPAAPFRGAAETELDALKNRLLRQELARAVTLDTNVVLRRAANDAAALAWLTPYPLLVLPALFEEKARAARTKASRQSLIRERSTDLLALAE